MKLRRLDLLRYGHLTNVALEFPDEVRLHVVHGANEAGKSTALAAIADALFGFGHRTDFDFLHGPSQLRVGFTLGTGDGAEMSFVRRKGRRDTLRDGADETVPEDVLRRCIGGAGRELFERGFGLDGERLRQGGQELLRAGGEAGESLLAGAGLTNLRVALTRLEEEAKTLVGDGRGRRRLSEAVDAWRAAQRESEERAVAPQAWKDASAEHDRAESTLAEVQNRYRALAEEANRLQRVRRVRPLLAELTERRQEHADLADAPHLPTDAEARFAELVKVHADAERDADREGIVAARLTAERAALPLDDVALAAQDVIDALEGRRGIVRQAMTDLPDRQASAAALRASVMEAIGDLGLSLAPEAARDALPTAAARRVVARLISQHAARATASNAAARERSAGERRRDQAEQALAAEPEPASPALLRRTIDAVRGEGPLEADLSRAGLALASAEAAVRAALDALPLWSGDLAGLIACPLPLPSEAEAAAAALDKAGLALTQARDGVAGLEAEIAEQTDSLAALTGGETVPTRPVVDAARLRRDRVWRLVRRVLDGGPPPSVDDDPPDGSLPDAFEALRDEADRLSDRRADEAQRVADVVAATGRLEVLGGRLVAARAGLALAEAAVERTQAAWRALWAPTGLTPLPPAAMSEWRRNRDDVLRLADTAAAARATRDGLAERFARAHALLAGALEAGMDLARESLTALLLRAETACAAAEARAEEHRARRKALADAEARLPDLRQAALDAEAALDAWRRDWVPAIAPLGLPGDVGIEAAEAASAAWARIAETVPLWREDEGRIASMTDSIAAFAADVRAAQAKTSEAETDEPAPILAARLVRRLAEARKAAADAKDLTLRIAAHAAEQAQAAQRRTEAEQGLQALRLLAGVADDPGLRLAIERSRRRDALAQEILKLEQALPAQGDGLAEAALRAEAAGIDPDAVVGRLTEVDAELQTLGGQREDLSAQRTRAAAALSAMREGRDAATMAQEAANALADARAAAERYARLHVARVLLRAGVERFRKEQQGPMLRAAGAHFAHLTGGRYRRLIVDEDPAGKAVLMAIRDSDVECPVEALSEGTRDQLFLALRVAAIGAHAEQSEPLPFIADDLLVNFDDTRAAAALELLAELGRTTQVILFTHHDHIAALARRQVGARVWTMASVGEAVAG